jgi:hypothetical protein
MAKEASYTLHLERKLKDDPSKAAILALVGKITEYETRAELDEKVDAVREELDRRGGAPEEIRTEWEERLASMERQLQEAEEARGEALAQAAEHERQAKIALRVAEREQVARIIAEETRDLDETEVDTIKGLCEDITDEGEVRTAIADHKRQALVEVSEPRRVMDDDEADRIRARVGRGKERDLHEDTHGGSDDAAGSNGAGSGPLSEFGMDVSSYEKLAGTGRPS